MKSVTLVLLLGALIVMVLSLSVMKAPSYHFEDYLHYVEGVDKAGFNRTAFDAFSYELHVDRKNVPVSNGLAKFGDELAIVMVGLAAIVVAFSRFSKIPDDPRGPPP